MSAQWRSFTPAPLPPARGFAQAEYEHRLARAQRAMATQDLDLLFLTTEADIRWFTGFMTAFWRSPTRPWFLLVPATGLPIAVIPSIGEPCMRRTWLADIRTWRSPQPADDGIGLLVETIAELTGRRAMVPSRSGDGPTVRIGLPMGPGTTLRMPLADYDRLRSGLSGCRWHDATALLNTLRVIKSPAEIDKIRFVCQAVSRAFDALPEYVVPGMSDRAVFRAFTHRCLDEGVDEVDYLVGAAGAGGYGDVISPPSARRLRAGDVLMLDTGCRHDGYYCDFDRNWAIGPVEAATADAYRIVWDATAAGLDAARPGVRCDELFAVMRAVLAPHAAAAATGADRGDIGRAGHGIGIELTEPPSIMPADTTELRPGMVITLEPGLGFAPGRTMVHEEDIVITDSGCALLSVRAPAELPRIGDA